MRWDENDAKQTFFERELPSEMIDEWGSLPMSSQTRTEYNVDSTTYVPKKMIASGQKAIQAIHAATYTSTTSSFMLFGTPCMKRRKSSLTPKSVRGDAKIKRFSHTQRTYVRNSAAFLNPPSLTMKVSKVKKRGRDLLSWMENGEGVSEWVRSSSRYETTFFAEKEESRGWTQTVGE